MNVRLATRCAMLAVVAFAAFGAAKPALSQAPAAQPSPQAVLLAKQIVELKGVKTMFDPVVRGVVEKVKDVLLQTNFMLAKDLNESAAAVHKDYDARSSELVDATARIYARHFTEAELKDILAFYQSPAGKKLLVEEPKATEESVRFAADWADNLSTDVMARMRAEMKKRGHDL